MIYICKIELDDIAPRIWRQFQFHPEITFDQLHKIIQVMMGWEDYHLYEFHIGGQNLLVCLTRHSRIWKHVKC